jgi:tetratricopeptide (TPR) repeat protein
MMGFGSCALAIVVENARRRIAPIGAADGRMWPPLTGFFQEKSLLGRGLLGGLPTVLPITCSAASTSVPATAVGRIWQTGERIASSSRSGWRLTRLPEGEDRLMLQRLPVHATTTLALTIALTACSNPEADKQRYYESGNQFFEQKKYQEAIVEYRNALRADEMFGEARYRLAESYAAVGDAQNAYRQYIRAADLLPDNVDAQMRAATVLAVSRQFDDAKTRVQRVLDKEPNHVEAHVLLGTIMAGMRDLDAAITQVEEAIQIDPSRGATYSSLGALQLAQGDRDAARAAFARAVEIDPKSVDARMALALFQLQTGEAVAAEETLKGALALAPMHAMANRTMAVLYLASNRAPEAERYLKAFVDGSGSDRAAFALADYYVGLNRPDAARAVLQPMAEREATAADAEVRLARIDYTADKAAAYRRIDAVIAKRPQHADAMITKARWLLADGKPNDALTHALGAAKAAPENAAAHYTVGMSHVALHDAQSAMTAFNEVIRLNPRAAAAQLQLSRLQLAQGAVAETVELAESALKNAPGSVEARMTLVSGLIAQRDFNRADPLVAALLKDFPNAPQTHAIVGMQQLGKKNLAEARAAYERALSLDRRSYTAIAGLTTIDLLQRNTAAARTRVEARLAETPQDVRVLLLASRVYMAASDAATAERTLRRVVDLAPADSRAYALLGSIYIAQKRLPEARAEYDRLAAKSPKNVAVRTVAAMLSHSTNDIEDAKRRYREILDIDGSAAVAANNLAWILTEEGKDLDEALRLAERAAASAPNRPEIQDTLGWIYYRKELPLLAIPRFEKSVAEEPENATYRYHLALAHAKSGNVAQAKEAVTVALKLDPNHREARELQATLR